MSYVKEGIHDFPDMLKDYILTDANDNVPYFMIADIINTEMGKGVPKFFSFSANSGIFDRWGYLNVAREIFSYTTKIHSYYNTNENPLKVRMVEKGDFKLLYSSLFMMQEKHNNANILLMGMVKEENIPIVKEMLALNDINVHDDAFKKLSPFIEVWLADDFDIPKSQFYMLRFLYRKYIRRVLIGKGLRIILKPRIEMNNLLIKRTVNFETLDLLQNKINSLCQITSSLQVNKSLSPNTSQKSK